MSDENSAQANRMPEKEKIITSRSNPPAENRQGTVMYNFNECLLFLEAKGKEIFGVYFKVYLEDRQLIYKLLVYMIGDEANAGKFGLDIHKGILLTGPVGYACAFPRSKPRCRICP